MRSLRGCFLWFVREACAVCAGGARVARPGGSLPLAPSVPLSPVFHPSLSAPEAPLPASLFTFRPPRFASPRSGNCHAVHALEGHADSGWLPPSVHAPEVGLQTLPDTSGDNAGNELIFPALNDCV